MNTHEQFTDLIFSEDPIPEELTGQLADHIAQCDTCAELQSTWEAVDELLKQRPVTMPSPGFTDRWLTFQQQKIAEKNKTVKLNLLAGVGGVILLLSISIGILSYTPGKLLESFLLGVKLVSILQTFFLQIQNLLNIIRTPLLFTGLFALGIAIGYIGLGLFVARNYWKTEQGVHHE